MRDFKGIQITRKFGGSTSFNGIVKYDNKL